MKIGVMGMGASNLGSLVKEVCSSRIMIILATSDEMLNFITQINMQVNSVLAA